MSGASCLTATPRPGTSPYFVERARLQERIARLGGLRVFKMFKKQRRARHAKRALACLDAGVPNTGRQWRKLRKSLRARGGHR